MHDYVKAAHDQGVLAGVSAHNPDCIQQIADEGWEVDFFMGCFYFLTRKTFQLAQRQNARRRRPWRSSIRSGAHDPLAMTRVIRQVKQPCLGFKILGAGRLCANQDTVRQAFRFAFENIKPTDGVIVGMYPRFFDEITANVQFMRRLWQTRLNHATDHATGSTPSRRVTRGPPVGTSLPWRSNP